MSTHSSGIKGLTEQAWTSRQREVFALLVKGRTNAALTHLAADGKAPQAGLRTAGISTDGRAVVDQYAPFDPDPTFHREA